MESVTIATWNMKSIAPKLWGVSGSEDLWRWAEENIGADIYVFTEAKIPKSGVPTDWQAIYEKGGVGPRRPWGTVIASKRIDIRKLDLPKNVANDDEFEEPHQATTLIVEAAIGGEPWATIVGTYGLMLDSKSGFAEIERILWKTLDALAASEIPVVVAGDFNLHPNDVRPLFAELNMTDVLSVKGDFPVRIDGVNGTRVWTHRNTDNPGAAVQELDFIFVTDELITDLLAVRAGIEDFFTAFEVSDHAPVLSTFRLR